MPVHCYMSNYIITSIETFICTAKLSLSLSLAFSMLKTSRFFRQVGTLYGRVRYSALFYTKDSSVKLFTLRYGQLVETKTFWNFYFQTPIVSVTVQRD